MVEKNRKPQNQFEAEASTSSHCGSGSVKPIFDGVSIFVDGFTVPSSQVMLYMDMEVNGVPLKVFDEDIGQDKILGIAKLTLNDLEAETKKELDLRLQPSLDMLKIKIKRIEGLLQLRSYTTNLTRAVGCSRRREDDPRSKKETERSGSYRGYNGRN